MVGQVAVASDHLGFVCAGRGCVSQVRVAGCNEGLRVLVRDEMRATGGSRTAVDIPLSVMEKPHWAPTIRLIPDIGFT